MSIELNGTTGITSPNLTGDGSGLTSLTSANLTGALPAIDGSALTGVGASTTVGTVGTYALLREPINNATVVGPGGTKAGSSLVYSGLKTYNAASALVTGATSPLGTWQIMGTYSTAAADNDYPMSVWLRTS